MTPPPSDLLAAAQRDLRAAARHVAALPDTAAVRRARNYLDRLREALEDAAAELFEATGTPPE